MAHLEDPRAALQTDPTGSKNAFRRCVNQLSINQCRAVTPAFGRHPKMEISIIRNLKIPFLLVSAPPHILHRGQTQSGS